MINALVEQGILNEDLELPNKQTDYRGVELEEQTAT